MPTVASPPTNLMVTQRGVTSVRVTWTPPSPAGDTTGYSIFYSSGQLTETVDVSGTSAREVMLRNLIEGGKYFISLLATSQHLPSEIVTETLQLVLGNDVRGCINISISLSSVPRDLKLSVTGTTETSITVSWSVAGGQVERYELDWGIGKTITLPGSTTSYTIDGLGEGETYTITLTATNDAGNTTHQISASTNDGKIEKRP